MLVSYITFYNNKKIIVKPAYRDGRFLYGHFYEDGRWSKTRIDMRYVGKLESREVKFINGRLCENIDEDRVREVVGVYYKNGVKYKEENTYMPDEEGKSEENPKLYAYVNPGGSEIFINAMQGIVPSVGNNVENTGSGTVTSPKFPQVDSKWYEEGFPLQIYIDKKEGKLIDYIPVDFYAIKDGEEKFVLPKLSDRLGYLDCNDNFSEELQWEGSFTRGQFMFTLLLDKSHMCCNDSKVYSNAYWELITELSDIKAGEGVTKEITIKSGITKPQSVELSAAIGSRVGFDADLEEIGSISSELSYQLSSCFDVGVSLTQQVSTTDKVVFLPQERDQRIATYQFIEKYTLIAGDTLEERIIDLNNTKKNPLANIARAEIQGNSYDYPSKYYAKVYVLKP